MQDNVSRKRIFAALTVSVSVLLISLLLLCFLKTPESAFHPDPLAEADSADVREENGVTYIGYGFTVTEFSESVKKGERAKITLTTEASEKISISVYYASGKSSSSVFVPKAAENGYVSWEWTVPKNTTADTVRIVLRGADTYATFNIDVE